MKEIYTLILTTSFIGNLIAFNSEKHSNGFESKTNNKVAFTENKGQIYNQNFKPRPDVLYYAMASNMAVHIKNSGISYQLYRIDKYKDVVDEHTKQKRKEIDQQTIYRIDLNWLNVNNTITQTTDEVLPGCNNYYLESCPNGALNVKSYTGITLNNLYNGINVHYYEKNGLLKYDYIVAPNSNYQQIQVQVRGAKVSLNKDGSLLLITPLGKVQEGAPVVFQNGKQLKAKWLLSEDNVLSFEIQNYKSEYELIIDPVTRTWGTYYGGIGDDYVYGTCTDAGGNVYMSGRTNSSANISTIGSHQSTIGGGSRDAFLVKFNSLGVRQWSTYYGGSAADAGYSCATDALGNVYLTGETTSTSGTVIATLGSHQSTNGGGSEDAFLVKFSSAGVRIWGTYYGGSSFDYSFSTTTDALGNVYIAGVTGSTAGISSIGSHQQVFGGSQDSYIAKFNSSGVRQWSTYYGGSSIENNSYCITDAAGNVFLSGSTSEPTSTIIATLGSHQPTFGGNADAYLVKFDGSGNRLWGTYYGGSGVDWGYLCATDGFGNVYLPGATESTAAIATPGSHQLSNGGLRDAYLVKFNSLGVRQWGTYYGGIGNFDESSSCAVDGSGNIYLSGYTDTNTGTIIATPASHQPSYGGGSYDAFLAKFSAAGVRQWGTYYGGSGIDQGYAVSVDVSGNSYLTGYSASTGGTIIATVGSHQNTNGGGSSDAFLVQFFDCTPMAPTNTTPVQNQIICSNNSATLLATGSGTINWFTGPTGGVAIANGTSFITPTLSTGNYTYYAESITCTTSINRTPITLTVNPSPTISVNSGSICSGNAFTINPSGANTYTIQGGNSIVTPTANTSYTVVGTSSAGCVSSTYATSNITVNPLPTISANTSTTQLCIGSSATLTANGASTYTWNPGGAGTSIVISPTVNTTYTVTGIDANGCQNTSVITQSVANCSTVGLQELSIEQVKIYPNPTSGILILNGAEGKNVLIYNTLGEMIFSSPLMEDNFKIDLSSYAKGVYFVRVGTINKKLILE